MRKLYFLTILLFISALSFGQSAENSVIGDTDLTSFAKQTEIEGFKLYPNPVTNGMVTITTARNLTRDVVIFNVLGRQVLNAKLEEDNLNVSSLVAGVYFIKVTEDKKTVTRKLVIK